MCLSADRLTCLDREGSLVGVGGTLYGERGSSCDKAGRSESLPNEETVTEGDETEEDEIEERVEVWLLRAAILREVSEPGGHGVKENTYLLFNASVAPAISASLCGVCTRATHLW